MNEQRQAPIRFPEPSRLLQNAAYVGFAIATTLLFFEVATGARTFGLVWILPLAAFAGWAVADFVSVPCRQFWESGHTGYRSSVRKAVSRPSH